jgi:hypothetical protein
MARTLDEIFTAIKESYVAERAAAGLVADDPALWSKVNLKRLIFYVVAFACFVQEQIFEKQRDETNADLANLRPPTVGWYAGKCLAYQHGFPLYPDSDVFDNTGYTDAEIEASKVIKYAAVQRQADSGGFVLFLRIKLCGESGNELAQLSNEIIDGFNEYLERFIPAGDNVQVLTKPADKIKMQWQVYYNPGILKADGSRLDGTDATPVKDAILAYLKTGMPFDGKYSITAHVDAVQKVAGVITPRVLACSASYDALPFVTISEYYQPDGGWLRFDDVDTDLEIEFISE